MVAKLYQNSSPAKQQMPVFLNLLHIAFCLLKPENEYEWEQGLSLREKCPNKELALVRMRENTGQKKILIWTLFTQYIGWILVRNNSFSTSEKFPEKQIFLTPWYTHVRVRIRGKKYEFLRKFCVCTKWIIPYSRTLIFICSCYKLKQRSITRFFLPCLWSPSTH